MHELLPLLQKPSHYAGIEDGACHKNPADINLRIALAFPDTYEVGMSYLGQKILYNIVNAKSTWWAERVMAPEASTASMLRERNIPLATLESDTPLKQLHAVCFSVTHELCFTDILHMLDLAHIPLRSADRDDDLTKMPLVMAGGGAMLGAEPLAPFLDIIALGDGEELFPEILQLLEKALSTGQTRTEFLRKAAEISGGYVPSFFSHDSKGCITPLKTGYRPARRIVADLNSASYPVTQVTPVGAVHNRLSLEIARGCTRGCRFCHAGIVYRPARERSIDKLKSILDDCLAATGYEEVSFLSLSAGDFSGLRNLYDQTFERCAREQISLSLPSLRVGSVDDGIMARIASLRRTGVTLAPEAGSQRLRDVINKGISEDELFAHVEKLLELGWRQVKFYFMIGLPTETDADLEAIFHLCRKARDIGGKGAKKIQITAAISTFVPKPFTPFQWEEQIGLEETRRRINLLRDLFRDQKFMKLKWHNPQASFLEGILSRGDRRLADVVEKAYLKGAVYCSWEEFFNLEIWLEAMRECGMEAGSFLEARNLDANLPWDHLESGVSNEFLLRERKKSREEKTTADCRYGSCGMCGVCDTRTSASRLPHASDKKHFCRLVFSSRDQAMPVSESCKDASAFAESHADIHIKAAQYRIWHCKFGNFAFLSQLELQAILERALRRAKIPLAFSRGFHPLPLMSFGRALPVGMESHAEWLAITLNEIYDPQDIKDRLNENLRRELGISQVEFTDKQKRTEQAVSEIFKLDFAEISARNRAEDAFRAFSVLDGMEYARQTKKGEKVQNIRPMLSKWQLDDDNHSLVFQTDWSQGYLSPVTLARAILGQTDNSAVTLIKIAKLTQIFADGSRYGLEHAF